MFDVTVIGPAVIDILASPVDLDAIAAGSRDLDRIRMSFGGELYGRKRNTDRQCTCAGGS